MILKIQELTCLRCNHKWHPRTEDVRQCPSCKTSHWDTIKTDNIGKRKNNKKKDK
jgi:Zn finger protein HypA/HybF involved in hydrogenase expression